jgi:hypothetical protein
MAEMTKRFEVEITSAVVEDWMYPRAKDCSHHLRAKQIHIVRIDPSDSTLDVVASHTEFPPRDNAIDFYWRYEWITVDL